MLFLIYVNICNGSSSLFINDVLRKVIIKDSVLNRCVYAILVMWTFQLYSMLCISRSSSEERRTLTGQRFLGLSLFLSYTLLVSLSHTLSQLFSLSLTLSHSLSPSPTLSLWSSLALNFSLIVTLTLALSLTHSFTLIIKSLSRSVCLIINRSVYAILVMSPF